MTESSGAAVTIPDGIREGLMCEWTPKGNKEAKAVDIWEESNPRRFRSRNPLSTHTGSKEAQWSKESDRDASEKRGDLRNTRARTQRASKAMAMPLKAIQSELGRQQRTWVRRMSYILKDMTYILKDNLPGG